MSSLASDEVAADFRDALQDLKMNSRAEITNLTIIAKENTEHAQAISRELENHVRSVSPEPVPDFNFSLTVSIRHGLSGSCQLYMCWIPL